MADRKLSNDASSSSQGTIFQLYVAVQKCLEMTSGQRIIIERYGDVTVSASQQMEIKHYDDPLTDSHVNFWKTLKNWMRDDFDESAYAVLLLCTTQEIGEKSLLKEWNSNDLSGRIAILKKIHEEGESRYQKEVKSGKRDPKKPSESLILQRWVMDPARIDKLLSVVERYIIADLSPDISNLYGQIKDIHAKGILLAKRDDFLNALLGFVLCPKVVVENSWEIGFDEFSAKVQELTAQYCKGTTQFPGKNAHASQEASPELVESKKDQLFVVKIHSIEYHEVIPRAIGDYLYASETVLKELRDYEVPTSRFQAFARDVLDQSWPRYRRALRSISDVVKDSQNFYDEVMMCSPPTFPGFDTPPLRFRNGVLHMHCNDTSKGVKWRLDDHE